MDEARFDFTVDLSGLERIKRQTPAQINAWLRGLAEDVATDVKLSFGTSPDGRSYTRGGVTHVASQPDHPPNVDTGALSGSIIAKRISNYEYEVRDGVEYGIYLEDGTEDIAPRPFMVPAFDNLKRTMEREAKTGLDLE